uniref:Uncharacterized protein n=1 Tax=Rhizophora mucronata TaxID=61149 RepID=A0A2P2P563_RHIMU
MDILVNYEIVVAVFLSFYMDSLHKRKIEEVRFI